MERPVAEGERLFHFEYPKSPKSPSILLGVVFLAFGLVMFILPYVLIDEDYKEEDYVNFSYLALGLACLGILAFYVSITGRRKERNKPTEWITSLTMSEHYLYLDPEKLRLSPSFPSTKRIAWSEVEQIKEHSDTGDYGDYLWIDLLLFQEPESDLYAKTSGKKKPKKVSFQVMSDGKRLVYLPDAITFEIFEQFHQASVSERIALLGEYEQQKKEFKENYRVGLLTV